MSGVGEISVWASGNTGVVAECVIVVEDGLVGAIRLAKGAVVEDLKAGPAFEVTPDTDSRITGIPITSGAIGQAGVVVEHVAKSRITREAAIASR